MCHIYPCNGGVQIGVNKFALHEYLIVLLLSSRNSVPKSCADLWCGFNVSYFQITARKLMEDVSYSAAKSVGNTILWLMHRVVEDTRTDDQLRAGQEELRLKQV